MIGNVIGSCGLNMGITLRLESNNIGSLLSEGIIVETVSVCDEIGVNNMCCGLLCGIRLTLLSAAIFTSSLLSLCAREVKLHLII
jgi:hypothetical protein